MSKFSRNVKTFPTELFQSVEHEKNQINKLNGNCESKNQAHSEFKFPPDYEQLSTRTLSTISSGSDLDGALYLDFDKLSGLSSTSSTSWSDEYELDVTKKALFAMEKLDSIFQGMESCSREYCKGEIDEWKELFGNISILGRITPSNSTTSSDVESEILNPRLNHDVANSLQTQENVQANTKRHSKNYNIIMNKDCDIHESNSKTSRELLRETEQMTGELKHLKTGISKHKFEDHKIKNKSVFTFSNKPKSLDIEKYLKISSIKSPKPHERKMSSKSLRHQKFATGLAEDPHCKVSKEYDSLPFLPDFAKKYHISTKYNKKSIQSQVKKTNGNLILPPINLNYRSVSATPRASSKISSAVSKKFSNFHSKNGPPVIDYLDDISISNR